MRLHRKIALVTGAASGIGKTIAHSFVQEGARVVVADLRQEDAESVAKELQDIGGEALAVAMDVTSESQVDAGFDRVLKKWGGVDILVSNAGIQHIDPVVDLTYADWHKVVSVHLDGGFLTTRAALRQIYQHGRGGSIIYMGSVHSKEASVLKAPYVAAKHGLLGLARVVAKEGAAHNVRANVICPGFVRTPLVEKQIPEQAADLHLSEQDVIDKVMLKDTVDKQFTAMTDMAELAVFFASFPSNALTGQSVVVSHGWFMQ